MDKIKIYKVLPEERLILEYLKGKVTWGEYTEMKKEEVADPGYNAGYDVIVDIRDLHTDFSLKIEKEILNYIEFLSDQEEPLNHRSSVITDTPKQLLHAEFFKMSGGGLPIKLKTVSTYESAFDYIQLNIEKHQKIIYV